MSLAQHLAMIPPVAWPLGVGLLVNSTILFGNVGLSIAGPVPIVRERLGKSALKEADKVRVWALFYKTAAPSVLVFVDTAPVLPFHARLGFITLTPPLYLHILRLTTPHKLIPQANIVPGIISSTLLHLLSAYLTYSPRVRQFSLIAAGASASVIPYTLFAILPTNKLLLSIDAKKEITPAEARDVGYLIDKWDRLHSWRFLQYGLGWTAGLGALLGVVGRW